MDAQNRESASDVSRSSGSVAGTAARMKRTLSDKAEDAKESLNEFGRKAADRFENSRESTASAPEWTATSLHSRADQISDITHTAADRLQNTADYVRERDMEAIFADVQSAVRRHPGRSLAVAAVLGFLIARGLRRLTA